MLRYILGKGFHWGNYCRVIVSETEINKKGLRDMKRKMLTVVLLMCVILSSCGTKVEGVGDDDIEVPDISQPDDSNTDIDNSAMNEDPLSEEEKLRRASEEIHYIRENERIDKVLENTYVTTIMINLKCNSRMPFGRITTEDDVKMAKEFLGYDFCWVVEDYPIEDYDYMVKYSDGYSAPRGYRLTGVKFNEAHDYYYVDYELRVFQGEDCERENQGYLDIFLIPKEIIPLGEMN